MKHKTQHFIPQSYLAAWTDPDVPAGQEPFVWVVPKDGGEPKRKAPKNIFSETDMYTVRLPDGSRDLSLEHGLSELESRFSSVRRDVLDNRLPVDPASKLVIVAFTAAMHARTPKQRDHWQRQWQGVLEDMDALKRAMDSKSHRERQHMARTMGPSLSSGPSMSHADVRRLAANPLPTTMVAEIDVQVGPLFAMDLAVLYTEGEPGFITSDAPCMWYDAEVHARKFPFNTVGLAFPSIEILLPVSPRCALILNRRGRAGAFMAKEADADEFNRFVQSYAYEALVVSKPVLRDAWFDSGSAPPKSPRSG